MIFTTMANSTENTIIPPSANGENDLNFNYYIYYINNHSIRLISKTTFKNIKGRVIVAGKNKYRIVGSMLRDKVTFNEVKRRLLSFEPQGFMWNSFKGLMLLGHVTDKLGNAVKKVTDENIRQVILDLISIVLDLSRLASGELKVIDIISALISLYRGWTGASKIFEAQSLDALVLSTLSLILPKSLFEIVKRMNLFTNMKFLDDPTLFHSFVSLVIEYIETFLKYIKLDKIWKGFKPFFTYLKDKVSFIKLKKCNELAIRLLEDKNSAMNVSLRVSFLKMAEELKMNANIIEWSKRSATISGYLTNIEGVVKMLRSYENAFRTEPSCFVFEGVPGVFKSVYMNGLIEVLGLPCYYHSIKAAMDGKDWYDNYNNEDIFSMDDVGSQGISQWRTIVNLVSPTKLPLDCAEANKKDTKFFQSKLILLTTNAFESLQGLTKNDCISDIRALWRRGYVFRFDVRRQGNMLRGQINFRYYNTNTQQFESTFPADIQDYLTSINLNIQPYIRLSYNDTDQKNSVLAWMCDIVNVAMKVKELQKTSNSIDLNAVKSKLQFQPNANEADVDEITRLGDDLMNDDSYDTADESNSEYSELSSDGIYQLNPAAFKLYRQYLSGELSDDDDSQGEEISSPLTDTDVSRSSVTHITRTEAGDKTYWTVALELINTIINPIYNFLHKGKSLEVISMLLNTSIAAIIGSMISILVHKFVVWCFEKNKKNTLYEVQSNQHPMVPSIQKSIYEADFYVSDNGFSEMKLKQNLVLASGHCLVTVSHPFINTTRPIQVTLYRDRETNSILVDKLFYEIVYINLEEDVCVLKCKDTIPSPFKNLSKHFKVGGEVAINGYFVDNLGVIKLKTISCDSKYPAYYKAGNMTFNPQNYINYRKQGTGTCGSLIIDCFQGIIGMHVAGAPAMNVGIGVIWTVSTKNIIKDILEKDDKFLLDVNISEKNIPNFSGIKLDKKLYLSSPKKTNIQPTDLYGLFETTRVPSDLSKYGPHTVKTVAKKSFQPLQNVDLKELDFAEKVMNVMIPHFEDISEEIVVKGDEYLAPLNKDSSNGYGCHKDKSYYIDFEKGKYTENLRPELEKIQQDIENGIIEVDKFLWSESLKDETRDVSKEGEPRSFRVGTIFTQVLTKELTGDLVRKIIKCRGFNGIAIGMNPIVDWPELYNDLLACKGKHWASDVKKWDGAMLAQVQQVLSNCVIKKYRGDRKVLLDFFLSSVFYCLVGMNDDLYLTNHSFPSGSFWTALFNSLVNKLYTAMWYYRECVKHGVEPTVSSFFADLKDTVLGDDKIIGVKTDNKPYLNALTMNEFFKSIGLDTTTSKKTPIIHAYDNIEDLTFLKRSFRYHPLLRKVTCPLDLGTICSTIQWYDTKKEYADVVRDKLHCFQREAFLHADLYQDLLSKLIIACKDRDVPLAVLPEEYLIHLYLEEPELVKDMAFNNMKYL